MHTLELSALEVESFATGETDDDTKWGGLSSDLPMCTCVSCTEGFPDCDTHNPKICPPDPDATAKC